jgi:hypothetical protein
MTVYTSGSASVEYRCTIVSGVAPSWNARMTNSSRTRESPTRRAPAASSRRGGCFGLNGESHVTVLLVDSSTCYCGLSEAVGRISCSAAKFRLWVSQRQFLYPRTVMSPFVGDP